MVDGRMGVVTGAVLAAGLAAGAAAGPPPPVAGLEAVGHDSRVDLRWRPAENGQVRGYRVLRAGSAEGPFAPIGPKVHLPHVYSDFLGHNGREYFYRVVAVGAGGESAPSEVVSARPRAMNDLELLDSVQQATLRYFWDWGHPVSGLARERNTSRDVCATGGTGVGLMAIMVGAERGFVPRRAAAGRVRKILAFLQERAERYHGAWSHWINGRTGRTVRFSRYDDGGDLVETALLMQGVLTVRRYFDRDDPVEAEIRRRATEMWRGVEWRWYLRAAGGKALLWHWSPNYGWKINLRVGGMFNECLITYVLAVASPTHPIGPGCYREGWAGPRYANGRSYFGIRQAVGLPMGGPLFFTHYSFLGLDPRRWRDPWCNYFRLGEAIARIHRAYCIANPGGHRGYGADCWGLTACDGPDGYRACAPGRRDTGTIAPTAAISSMPYTPRASVAALKHYYHDLGPRLWGEFGFRDAFNLERDWFASSYIALDQGPIVVMIENYRSGLPWRMFMSNAEIPAALEAMGWRREPAGGPTSRPAGE